MNGIHDLGGRDGIGAINPTESEPVWKAEWEKHAHTFFPLAFRAGFFGVDSFRFGMEQMDPVEYLTSPYYEHWLHSVTHHGVRKGLLDPEEIEKRTQYYLEHPDAPLPEDKDPEGELVAFIEAVIPAGAPAGRDTGKVAKFAVGDRVTVVADAPHGHTRKANYIRGKTGVVELAHGEMIYPDTAGNDLGEAPEHVYTVRFTNAELWGAEAAEPNGSVTFDVWEPYIVPASE
ncbi:nitrile hydratase subunit beta [Actinomycetospora sp. TBRC 11914]|uniref:nitrile hydratase subunit beta n=1 Tax=Actinomycetospora sp. TBRC 11914 TaxID=2729387 RepID=UPI00145DA86E|nr:nitrile hydratase subunit beta [Actinomycetospora sp. TBRC 11914]NMO92231.1 nitrile hydratase subunit beta [Actinomycetospora sp. TBRC 11914]